MLIAFTSDYGKFSKGLVDFAFHTKISFEKKLLRIKGYFAYWEDFKCIMVHSIDFFCFWENGIKFVVKAYPKQRIGKMQIGVALCAVVALVLACPWRL